MEKKTWRTWNQNLSWSTKVYVLLAVLIGIGSFAFQAWSTNWSVTILFALAIILLVEHFSIVAHRHPKSWKIFKWIILLLACALLFIS